MLLLYAMKKLSTMQFMFLHAELVFYLYIYHTLISIFPVLPPIYLSQLLLYLSIHLINFKTLNKSEVA